MKRLLFVVVALVLLVIVGLVGVREWRKQAVVNRFTCSVDSDCEVKNSNVGCGNPGCYNKDYVMPPRKNDGTAGVCGFPSFDECRCVASRCVEFNKGVRVN